MDKTKRRIYIDTSVIGGFEDYKFSRWSIQLFEEFRQGLKTAVISNLTQRELEGAPESVEKDLLSLISINMGNVSLTEEAESLAQNYIDDGVVGAGHIADARAIAIASVERVDVLVSWNFRHIVNLDRIHAFNSVNLKLGYLILEIRIPREVIRENFLYCGISAKNS